MDFDILEAASGRRLMGWSSASLSAHNTAAGGYPYRVAEPVSRGGIAYPSRSWRRGRARALRIQRQVIRGRLPGSRADKDRSNWTDVEVLNCLPADFPSIVLKLGSVQSNYAFSLGAQMIYYLRILACAFVAVVGLSACEPRPLQGVAYGDVCMYPVQGPAGDPRELLTFVNGLPPNGAEANDVLANEARLLAAISTMRGVGHNLQSKISSVRNSDVSKVWEACRFGRSSSPPTIRMTALISCPPLR